MLMMTRDVYLDHNATTPLDPEVRKAMARALERTWGNPSSLHRHGRAARGAVEDARLIIASTLGCEPRQLYFTSGGTEGNNTVLKGVFAAAGAGHIITTAIEHDSVLGACQQIEALGGRITRIHAQPDGRVRPQHITDALTDDTLLISVMHANNETGAIQPLAEIAHIARLANVPLHADAVQTFGKLPFDVDQLGVEFLTLSAHKINGPKGAGALFWRGNTPWHPLLFGGGQELHLRAGTEGIHQIVGLGKACELAVQKRASEAARLADLRHTFLDDLRRLAPDLRVNEASPPFQLASTLNLTFPGRDGIRLLAGLDCYEISVSIGSACTAEQIVPSHVLIGMGMPAAEALSSIRISMGRTTTRADLRYTIKAFERVLESDPAGFSYLDAEHLDAARIRSDATWLIDLRLPHERLLDATIPGATELSYLGFDRAIKRIPRDREVILLCDSGQISTAAGYRLAMAGHPNVRAVFGGYQAWRGRYPQLLEELRR